MSRFEGVLQFILLYFTLNKSSVFWTVMDACPNPLVLRYHLFIFYLCVTAQINSFFKRCMSNPSIWLARNIIFSDKVFYWCSMFWLKSLEIFETPLMLHIVQPAQIIRLKYLITMLEINLNVARLFINKEIWYIQYIVFIFFTFGIS